MNAFILYLLKANIILSLFYGFYVLLLKRDTFFNYRRWYLLCSLSAALLLPFLNISVAENDPEITVWEYIPSVVEITEIYLNASLAPETVPTGEKATGYDWSLWICTGLLAGMIYLLAKRIGQGAKLLKIIRQSEKKYYGKHQVVISCQSSQIFSFFNKIILPDRHFSPEELNEILAHEDIHGRNKHSCDLLLCELVTCLCWYNPFIWWMRNDLRQNLEFYTDHCILQKGFNDKHYQYNLLNISCTHSFYPIVNHFQLNHLKKRIIMMNKKKTSPFLAVKYLLVIPLVLATLFTIRASDLDKMVSDNMPESLIPEQWTRWNSTEQEAGESTQTPERNNSGLKEELQSIIEAKEIVSAGFNHLLAHSDEKTDGKAIETVSPEKQWNAQDTTIKQTPVSLYAINQVKNQANPLYMVNGKEISPDEVGLINPQTIESIDVFKGDKAIELYGEKAANGVVVIHLKKNVPIPTFTPGNDKYLVVIDGKELSYDKFQNLHINPNAVQSITVFKDPSAIAKYGEKGKNGVVTIELKKEFQEPEKKKEETIPDYRIRQGTSTTTLQNEKTSLISDDLQVDISHVPFNISDITHVKSENSGPIIVTTRRKDKTHSKEALNMNPLFIVDGIAVDSVDEVSPENIQTISVLKEKSAIALYGEKAKNGVVIITTKAGK